LALDHQANGSGEHASGSRGFRPFRSCRSRGRTALDEGRQQSTLSKCGAGTCACAATEACRPGTAASNARASAPCKRSAIVSHNLWAGEALQPRRWFCAAVVLVSSSTPCPGAAHAPGPRSPRWRLSGRMPRRLLLSSSSMATHTGACELKLRTHAACWAHSTPAAG
jgi:hypothetical protein